jgi:hypothetical protein
MNEVAGENVEVVLSSAPALPAEGCQDAQAWLDWACAFA